MFDSLRDQQSSSLPPVSSADIPDVHARGSDAPRGSSKGRFMGMTAGQRLLIAVLLMLSVCIVGTMCLLVTGRIGTF
jgi:hypothetical protein